MDQPSAQSPISKPDKIVAIDLELNQLNGNPKIIEIGISVGDIKTRQILETKRFFVNPEEEITEYINKLTGITQAMVANAPTISGAYDEVKVYLSQFNYRKQLVEWGNGDVYKLRGELMKVGRGIDDDWIFGWATMNVKGVAQAIKDAKGISLQSGLAKSMNFFGIRFIGVKHQAGDDAENTLRLYFELLRRLGQV